MSAQPYGVDVLAILDSLIAEYEFQGEVVEARAAVAELIAAARAMLTEMAFLESHAIRVPTAKRQATANLRSALTHIGPSP